MKCLFLTSLSVLTLVSSALARADEAINPERPGFTNGAATVG